MTQRMKSGEFSAFHNREMMLLAQTMVTNEFSVVWWNDYTLYIFLPSATVNNGREQER